MEIRSKNQCIIYVVQEAKVDFLDATNALLKITVDWLVDIKMNETVSQMAETALNVDKALQDEVKNIQSDAACQREF